MTSFFKFLLPFIVLFALLGLLTRELFSNHNQTLPSALINQSIPTFVLPELLHPNQFFRSEEMKGKVSLLNIWATWCYACRIEHALLLEIKEKYHIPVYSINYKDHPSEAMQWLQKKGNPYLRTGNDDTGSVAIDFGIYGTPETFVIDPDGKIIYRHVGALNHHTWLTVIYPLIKQAEKR